MTAKEYREKEQITDANFWDGDEIDFNMVYEFAEDYHSEQVKSFVKWHNEHYPDSYIPNSRIGKYNLSSEQEPKEWVSVEDRLPEEHKYVMVCYEDNHVSARMYDSTSKVFSPVINSKVTHWQHLPSPPNTGKADQKKSGIRKYDEATDTFKVRTHEE